MDDLARPGAARAAKMPSQGVATTYRDLNVHTQPVGQSPSFLQIKENEKVDVLAHVITPRADVPRKPLIPPTPKKEGAAQEKPKKEPKIPPPPMPKPPPLPDDWLELSKTDLTKRSAAGGREAAKSRLPMDDWSLVRTPRDSPAGCSRGWSRWRFPTKWRSTPRAAASSPISRWETPGRGPKEDDLALDHLRGRAALGFRQLPRVHLESAPPPLRDRVYRAQCAGLSAGAVEQCRLRGGQGRRRSIPGSRSAWRRRTVSGCAGSMRCWATWCAMPASGPCEAAAADVRRKASGSDGGPGGGHSGAAKRASRSG